MSPLGTTYPFVFATDFVSFTLLYMNFLQLSIELRSLRRNYTSLTEELKRELVKNEELGLELINLVSDKVGLVRLCHVAKGAVRQLSPDANIDHLPLRINM